MALLPVPALRQECTHTHSPSLPSLSSSGNTGISYPSLKLFLHRPTQFRNRGYKLAITNIAEVERDSQQRRTQSPRNFRGSGGGSSSSSGRRRIPPWRTPWKPSRRKIAPSREESFSQQIWQRGWRGTTCDEDTERGNGEHAESSSNSLVQRTAMARIVEKLRDIQKTFDSTDTQHTEQNAEAEDKNVSLVSPKPVSPTRTAGELFLPKPKQNLFSIGNYWSTPDHPVPAPGRGVLETKFPWEFEVQDQQEEEEKKKRVKPPTLAELIIPPDRLKRLRTLGIALPNPIRIGRLGITDNIADKIIGQWRSSELVKVKCGGPAATNMMKIHKDLERKTGGLVVWRAGSVAVVYRGSDYDMVNKVASSLDSKLDGLLSSGHYPRNTLHNENHVQPKMGLSEVSEASSNSELKTESVGLGCNAVHDHSKKDTTPDSGAILYEGGLSVYRKGIVPNTDDVEDTNATVVDSHVNGNKVALQPMEAGDQERESANTVPGTGFSSQRLNVAPDPFVDRDYEIAINCILEGLGPRCKDWTGRTPVPVDADLLPSLVPNYRPPYRLLPYGVRPQLTNNEQTDLRRLVRHIAPHFVLGRNKGLQGLAAAILKLWEKSEVAKIAVKAGVQNTSSEKMAEELKRYTGGVLLARDRYFITLYRGKDFLPQQVAFALTERTSMLRNLGEGSEIVEGGISTINPSSIDLQKQKAEQDEVKAEAEKVRRLALAKQLEEKLAVAVEKKEKAEKDLEMLEAISTPVDKPADTETITEEEKYMFRRLGLKMGAFLLVGRRGVFNGVVENMHLHWKHRELVKLIVKERDPVQLQKTAKMLEYESGGVLITVEGTSKGHAIIIYRGKNYQRPELIRPHNLLNKKKALERSLEVQRRASLSRHISALEEEINKLKASLSDAERAKDDLLDAALNECSISSSDLKKEDVLEDEQTDTHMTGGVINHSSGEEVLLQNICTDKKTLLKLVGLGPIYRATRLTNLERLRLRKLALKLDVGARFNVGKSNALFGLARAIRIHFLKHSLVVIGVKNRGRGTSVQDLVHELEDLTGGVLVSQEQKQIIMYRGWPKGQKMPTAGSVEEVSPELLAALEAEEDWDMTDDVSYMTEARDASDDDDDEKDHASMLIADVAETDAEDKYEGLDGDIVNDVSYMTEARDASDDDDDEDLVSMVDDVSYMTEAWYASDDDDDEDLVSMLTAMAKTDAKDEGLDLHGSSKGADEEISV